MVPMQHTLPEQNGTGMGTAAAIPASSGTGLEVQAALVTDLLNKSLGVRGH